MMEDYQDAIFPAVESGVFIILPVFADEKYHEEQKLAEAQELVKALGIRTNSHDDSTSAIGYHVVPMREVNPATFIGKGHLEMVKEKLWQLAPPKKPWHKNPAVSFVYIDHALSAVQQRNMEKFLGCYVEDREGLILNIFSKRAKSDEGRLQVKMARLQYDQSRLVRSWTHLERQRSTGNIGGPGERQIELDKRKIADDIKKIEKKLVKVRKTRQLHRKTRTKVPYPIVALVGYTNAGKSSLFNFLTGAKELSVDLLFATLDTHLRRVVLPSKRVVLFSDTVGFISHLPAHLIAAFRATLEELEQASIILHLADLSADDFVYKVNQVDKIMEQLPLPQHQKKFLIGNKYDVFKMNGHSQHLITDLNISAKTGDNVGELLTMIDDELDRQEDMVIKTYRLKINDNEKIGRVYRLGRVVKDEVMNDPPFDRHITVKLTRVNSDKLA